MGFLKEKDVVNYLVENWNRFFPDLEGCKKEFKIRNSRVDIFSSLPVNLKDLGLRETDTFAKAAVFCEVKYDSDMRDLMFEIQKHISFRDWYINYGKAFCMIIVISDKFDYEMVKFMEYNNIFMYKINIENNDLTTLTLEEYTLSSKEIEEGINKEEVVNS